MLKKKVSLPSDKIKSPVTAFIALENYNAIKLIHVSLIPTNLYTMYH